MEEKPKYNHAEAFAFMTYAPEGNKHLSFKRIYKIWNSRDGVTPMNYPINGEMCIHVNWQLDTCVPEYKLNVGDMYWRDKTEEEARAGAIRTIERYKGSKYEVDREDYERILNSLIEDYLRVPVIDIYK